MQPPTSEAEKLKGIESELITLAAQMVKGEGLPSTFRNDHPKRFTPHYAMQVYREIDETAKVRAMLLRQIVDKINAVRRTVSAAIQKED